MQICYTAYMFKRNSSSPSAEWPRGGDSVTVMVTVTVTVTVAVPHQNSEQHVSVARAAPEDVYSVSKNRQLG